MGLMNENHWDFGKKSFNVKESYYFECQLNNIAVVIAVLSCIKSFSQVSIIFINIAFFYLEVKVY